MYIAIDFGGTFVKYGIVNNKKILFSNKFPAKNLNFNKILKKVSEFIKELLRSNDINLSNILGLGVSIPGIVDYDNQRLISINEKHSQALNFNFQKWGEDTFNKKTIIDNDAKLALAGEVHFGIAQNKTDVALAIFGTGIGTAVMMNGNILRSRNHIAGNLGGHIASVYNGKPCNCGNIGCAETYASNSKLNNYVTTNWNLSKSILGTIENIDYRAIVFNKDNDEIANIVFHDLVNHWGNTLVNLVHAYDPNIIILSGGLIHSKDIILPKLQEYINKHSWLPNDTAVDVVCSVNPGYSALLGVEWYFKQINNK